MQTSWRSVRRLTGVLNQLAEAAPLASRGSTLESSSSTASFQSRSTTVLCVRKGDEVVLMADGQVTRNTEIVKPNVKKVRTMIDGSVIGGFAGATADAFTLFERLESQLEAHPGQLKRAAVELAKLWRLDKYLRRLDATMVVADAKESLTITGNGDVVEPHDGVVAIGSGGPYALAAARALIDLPDYDAKTIAEKAMNIAADTCIYTNHNFTTLSLKEGEKQD
ncbi:g10134 [Coccomyxa viridis]|uniref:G10134 protein n=1 Tax=Coccomyxa viridis TaxID=1274662 RepID=A0ABP1G9H5_9CHLO